MLNKNIFLFGIIFCFLIFIPGMGIAENTDAANEPFGFSFLKRISGLWNGPVSSSTPAGSFDSWYVDFRPVSPGQVSQYSALDADTINYISFFIVKHDNRLKVAMRTEGFFQNKGCVTYEVIDTVKESGGYYRFSDFRINDKRAYTEFIFKNDDMFIMNVYTSKFNKFYPLKPHTQWEAKRADKKAASNAISHFNFPQAVMIKDFSDAFKDMFESIFYTFENDPYPSITQPYVGNIIINITIDKKFRIKDNNTISLILTTSPLYEGLKYDKEKLKYISRSAFLPAGIKTYTFKHVHPGKYHLYSFIDMNNDKQYLTGDCMSSDTDTVLFLKENGTVIADTKIDFVIP